VFVDLPVGVLRILVPIAGFVIVLVAVALLHRSTRAEDEPVARWRYRDLESDLSLLHPRLEERRFSPSPGSTGIDLLPARRMARALLIAAIAMPAVVGVWWILEPFVMDVMSGVPAEPRWYEVALPWAGAAGYLIGLGWMIRIYRADPEPGERTWRYRT
jgi:hypothetical protein